MKIIIPNNSSTSLKKIFDEFLELLKKDSSESLQKLEKLKKQIFISSKTSGFSKTEYSEISKKFTNFLIQNFGINSFESPEFFLKIKNLSFEISLKSVVSLSDVIELSRKLLLFDVAIRKLLSSKFYKFDISNLQILEILKLVRSGIGEIFVFFRTNKNFYGFLFGEMSKFLQENLNDIFSVLAKNSPKNLIGEFPNPENFSDFENFLKFLENSKEKIQNSEEKTKNSSNKKSSSKSLKDEEKEYKVLKIKFSKSQKEFLKKISNSSILPEFKTEILENINLENISFFQKFEKEIVENLLQFDKFTKNIVSPFNFLNLKNSALDLQILQTRVAESFEKLFSGKTGIEEFEILKQNLLAQKVDLLDIFSDDRNTQVEFDYLKKLLEKISLKKESFNLTELLEAWNQFFFLQKKVYTTLDNSLFPPENFEIDTIVKIFGHSYDFIQIEGRDLVENLIDLFGVIIKNFGFFSSKKFAGKAIFGFLNFLESLSFSELKKIGVSLETQIFSSKFADFFGKNGKISAEIKIDGLVSETEFLKIRACFSFFRHYKNLVDFFSEKKEKLFSKDEFLAFRTSLETSQKVVSEIFKINFLASEEYRISFGKFWELEELAIVSSVKSFSKIDEQNQKKFRPFSAKKLFVKKDEDKISSKSFFGFEKVFWKIFEGEKSVNVENLEKNFENSFSHCKFYFELINLINSEISVNSSLKFFEKEEEMFESVKSKFEERLSEIRGTNAFKNILYYARKIAFLYFKNFKNFKNRGNERDGNEKTTFKSKIEGSAIPQKYKKDLLRIAKLVDGVDLISGSGMTEKAYLDAVLAFPWKEKRVQNYDLKLVKKTLDDLQYSFSVPKQKILDDVATIKISNGKIKPSIICLIGKPGTGKTFFAQNLAKALQIPFEKISLAGLDDPSVLVGQRRGWIGAHAGKIVKSMTMNKTRSMVFLLDEIDKIGGKSVNSKASESVLLDILDQEQNNEFFDLFLEIPVDISNSWFVATANEIENISAPLLDRMEILEVIAYTDDEKIKIAKDYITPELIAENFIDIRKIDIKNEVYEFLMQEYGNVDGFRTIKKILKSAFRHANFAILSGRKKVLIDVKFTKEVIWSMEKRDFGFGI